MNTTTWAEIKDAVYGKKGTKRRDKLDAKSAAFILQLSIKQEQIAQSKKIIQPKNLK